MTRNASSHPAWDRAALQYEMVGRTIDSITDRAVNARDRGDTEQARTLFAEQRTLIRGPYQDAKDAMERALATQGAARQP